jgi:type I restriction enzyme, R subunit
VDASPSLRNKKDLIERFVDSVSERADVDESWRAFIAARRAEELQQIVEEEELDAAKTATLVDNAFRDGEIPTTGTAITTILPPVSRFAAGGHHAAKKRAVVDKLKAFFERFSGLS